MASTVSLPENYKIVMVAPTAAANAVAYDYICCKNAHKVWFIVQHQGTNDTDLTLSMLEATTVAGGSAAAIAGTYPVWVDTNAGTASDALVKTSMTGATTSTYVINTGVTTDQLVVIEWDPANFSAGFDCIALTDSGGNASNYVTVTAIIQERFEQATPPSAIIN